MTTVIFSYEYFVENSRNLDRNQYKLPEYSKKHFQSLKKKLNIRNDISNENTIKPTAIKKKEEVIATLFKNFNKITDNTYDKLSKEIISLITVNITEAEKICSTFFQVVLNNSFFSHLYAKLYKEFILVNNIFTSILEKQISEYVKSIPLILYVSPNEDYDKYCEYVKKVDSIKNFTTFLIHSLKKEIVQELLLLELACTFQNYCTENIDNEDKLIINDIYISNIDIIVENISHIICKNEEWNTFIDNINNLKETQGCGKNKKMHFKLLDITDKLNKK